MVNEVTVSDILSIHRILSDTFCFVSLVRDRDILNDIVDVQYTQQDLIGKIANMMVSFESNRPFIKGNKMMAFAVCDVLLIINGFRIKQENNEIKRQLLMLIKQKQFDVIHVEQWLRDVVERK